MSRTVKLVLGGMIAVVAIFFSPVLAPQAAGSKIGSAPARTAAFRAPLQAHVEPGAVAVYGYKIIHTYPHDRNAFTQGLIYDGGVLYEGTGLYGQSSLRKVELETGKVLQEYDLPPQYFGEGVTVWRNKLIQLTWQSHLGFVYEKETFRQLREFSYSTEGWGITHDGTRLIMSDGTSTLYFLNPSTFERVGRLDVRDNDLPVMRLNELEYVKGEIYANIWLTDRIAKISPQTGQVIGWVDLTGLLTPEERVHADVLNGIAYDDKRNRFFVTGKLWPKLFEIEVVPKP
jgi:glutamine cyclotransferase